MLELRDLQTEDLAGLPPEAMAALAARMLGHIREQDARIAEREQRIEQQQRELQFKEAKLQKVNFELARLKNWKFGAKTEAMSAEQRRLFEETLAEDEASLRAQLEQLQGKAAAGDKDDAKGNCSKRKPRRQPLPEGLPRVDHRTNPKTRIARCTAAADRWCASARMSARSWTSFRRNTSCTATSTANGLAVAARS